MVNTKRFTFNETPVTEVQSSSGARLAVPDSVISEEMLDKLIDNFPEKYQTQWAAWWRGETHKQSSTDPT